MTNREISAIGTPDLRRSSPCCSRCNGLSNWYFLFESSFIGSTQTDLGGSQFKYKMALNIAGRLGSTSHLTPHIGFFCCGEALEVNYAETLGSGFGGCGGGEGREVLSPYRPPGEPLPQAVFQFAFYYISHPTWKYFYRLRTTKNVQFILRFTHCCV